MLASLLKIVTTKHFCTKIYMITDHYTTLRLCGETLERPQEATPRIFSARRNDFLEVQGGVPQLLDFSTKDKIHTGCLCLMGRILF